MGPLTSPGHRDRVLSYIKLAEDDGDRVLTGGRVPGDPALAEGCYFEPTVVATRADHHIAREEVFGPVVAVQRFVTDEQALTIANDVEYGLGGGLWTKDLARAHRVARELRAGMVWVNSYKRVNPGSPFGGIGQSGYGREMGFEAMHEYTEAKAVWINYGAELPSLYDNP
jgi:acyl-CoA reductase-like NAD-dependent aldehyde dehydrogenase